LIFILLFLKKNALHNKDVKYLYEKSSIILVVAPDPEGKYYSQDCDMDREVFIHL
jgi:hypothetical protein